MDTLKENVMKEDIGSQKYKCDICEKCFTQKWGLEKHLNRMHVPKTITNQFSCKDCGKCFGEKENLNQHARTHDKKFLCNSCGKIFAQNKQLTLHKESHHDTIKDFHCNICDKNFTKNLYKAHIKNVHSDSKFKCENCDRAFTKKGNLNLHIKRVHFNEAKDCICEFCKEYFTKSQLISHIK